jgi:hypothetical protein
MRLTHGGRAAPLALMLLAALGSSGCPELNRQTAPRQDPLFSVDDPAGRAAGTICESRVAGLDDESPCVTSNEGGLPDLARRAR